jgi:hypothetical protein
MGKLPPKGAEASKGTIGPHQVEQHLGQEANQGIDKKEDRQGGVSMNAPKVGVFCGDTLVVRWVADATTKT